jgi:hypothetical protein
MIGWRREASADEKIVSAHAADTETYQMMAVIFLVEVRGGLIRGDPSYYTAPEENIVTVPIDKT